MHNPIEHSTDALRFWWRCLQLADETQSVVAMRMMGAGGMRSLPGREMEQMVSEKVPAFTESVLSGTLTALSGLSPARAGEAAISALHEKAQANRKRLAEHGPRGVALQTNEFNGVEK